MESQHAIQYSNVMHSIDIRSVDRAGPGAGSCARLLADHFFFFSSIISSNQAGVADVSQGTASIPDPSL